MGDELNINTSGQKKLVNFGGFVKNESIKVDKGFIDIIKLAAESDGDKKNFIITDAAQVIQDLKNLYCNVKLSYQDYRLMYAISYNEDNSYVKTYNSGEKEVYDSLGRLRANYFSNGNLRTAYDSEGFVTESYYENGRLKTKRTRVEYRDVDCGSRIRSKIVNYYDLYSVNGEKTGSKTIEKTLHVTQIELPPDPDIKPKCKPIDINEHLQRGNLNR